MFPILSYKLIVVSTLIFVPLTSCVELDLIDCGIDHETTVTVGDIGLEKYPFVGIFYYSYLGPLEETRATTTVVLIQKEFVIANAADIGPLPKHDFRKQSRVLLGENWLAIGRRVRNYVLHPEYGETYNTVALVQLKDPVRFESLRPVCPAPDLLRNPVFYVMKFKPDYNKLQKEVIPVAHIPAELCKDFYVKANLYSKKMRPPHVACAVSLEDDQPCVWDAGAALMSRDVWGRWILLGVGSRGPGCGAPARFLDMTSYGPWIKYSLERFQQITISRINKQKYVLRTVGGTLARPGIPTVYQRFGACDPEEKINLLYREAIILNTDNQQYQFLNYNLTITESVEFTCLTMELVNASGVSEMFVRHYCTRENFGPACYRYQGSQFYLSVMMMFSDGCVFEIYAWGHRKSMKLLDIQEWKWEEGTYYEDFSMFDHEYRGQTFMTEYGFEPLDKKMWVAEFDYWTTTLYPPTESTTFDEMDFYGMSTTEAYVEEIITTTPSTTTTTTTKRIKPTFRRKTTSTLIYFLWGVPRVNDTDAEASTDFEAEPYFFYRKNATGYGGVFI